MNQTLKIKEELQIKCQFLQSENEKLKQKVSESEQQNKRINQQALNLKQQNSQLKAKIENNQYSTSKLEKDSSLINEYKCTLNKLQIQNQKLSSDLLKEQKEKITIQTNLTGQIRENYQLKEKLSEYSYQKKTMKARQKSPCAAGIYGKYFHETNTKISEYISQQQSPNRKKSDYSVKDLFLETNAQMENLNKNLEQKELSKQFQMEYDQIVIKLKIKQEENDKITQKIKDLEFKINELQKEKVYTEWEIVQVKENLKISELFIVTLINLINKIGQNVQNSNILLQETLILKDQFPNQKNYVLQFQDVINKLLEETTKTEIDKYKLLESSLNKSKKKILELQGQIKIYESEKIVKNEKETQLNIALQKQISELKENNQKYKNQIDKQLTKINKLTETNKKLIQSSPSQESAQIQQENQQTFALNEEPSQKGDFFIDETKENTESQNLVLNEQLQDEICNLKQQLKKAFEENETYQVQIIQQMHNQQQFNINNQELQEQKNIILNELEQLKIQSYEIKKTLNEKESIIQNLLIKINQIQEEKKILQDEIKQKQSQVEQNLSNYNEKQSIIQNLSTQIDQIQAEKKMLQDEIKQKQNQLEQNLNNYNELKLKLEELDTDQQKYVDFDWILDITKFNLQSEITLKSNENIPSLEGILFESFVSIIGLPQSGKSVIIQKILENLITSNNKKMFESENIKNNEFNKQKIGVKQFERQNSNFKLKEIGNNKLLCEFTWNYLLPQQNNLEDLLQNFIFTYSNVIIFVLDRLSQYENEFLIKLEQIEKSKQIIVIHNLKYCIKIEQMHEYLQDTNLFELFSLEQNEKNAFIVFKENISHLFFGRFNSESGNYLNQSNIQFIQNTIENSNRNNTQQLNFLQIFQSVIIQNQQKQEEIISNKNEIELPQLKQIEVQEYKTQQSFKFTFQQISENSLKVALLIENSIILSLQKIQVKEKADQNYEIKIEGQQKILVQDQEIIENFVFVELVPNSFLFGENKQVEIKEQYFDNSKIELVICLILQV